MNNKLRKRFSKSPKYREGGTADYRKAKESIVPMIKSCILSWCNKRGVTTSSVLYGNSLWYQQLMKKLAISQTG